MSIVANIIIIACGFGFLFTFGYLITEIIKNSLWYQEKRRRNQLKKFTIIKGGKR